MQYKKDPWEILDCYSYPLNYHIAPFSGQVFLLVAFDMHDTMDDHDEKDIHVTLFDEPPRDISNL